MQIDKSLNNLPAYSGMYGADKAVASALPSSGTLRMRLCPSSASCQARLWSGQDCSHAQDTCLSPHRNPCFRYCPLFPHLPVYILNWRKNVWQLAFQIILYICRMALNRIKVLLLFLFMALFDFRIQLRITQATGIYHIRIPILPCLYEATPGKQADGEAACFA